MQIGNPSRIVVWSGGDEQRFLEWNETEWQVLESYNHGHDFEQSEFAKADIETPGDYFDIAKGRISTSDLLVESPEHLRRDANNC